MITRTLRLVAAVAAACALTTGAAAQKAAPSVAGKWTLTANTPHGDTPMALNSAGRQEDYRYVRDSPWGHPPRRVSSATES